jgi:hypothetical protein
MGTHVLTLASSGDEWMVVMFGGAFLVAIVAIISETVQKATKIKAREATRREIAAYVAEGSISADDGAKLIAAGESLKDKMGIKM